MLTTRGWWLLFSAIVLSLIGVSGAWSPTMAIVSLTVLTMMTIDWVLFAIRVRSSLRFLTADRQIHQGGRPVTAGWAGLTFQVRFTVTNAGRCRLSLVFAKDLVSNVESLGDTPPELNAVLAAGASASADYTLRPQHPGLLHFAGVHVTVSDLSGLFTVRTFIPVANTVTVLPALTDDRGRQRADKRFNTLPPPGLHRMRRPGGGSELLDLRDYRPGDPPKTIAWKPSARRDRLITREFESEVPIRCLLFLDASNGVRVGRDSATPLARLSTIAAGILQAATSNRDLVGLTIFDERESTSVQPGRTSTHSIRLMNDLAVAASRLPDSPITDAEALTTLAAPLLRERLPAAFSTANISHPWGLYWRPLLDRRWGWLIFLPFALTPVLVSPPAWLDFAAHTARRANPGTGQLLLDFPVFLFAFLGLLALPSTLASLFWLLHGLTGFLPPRRRYERNRKDIATVLAHIDRSTPATVERYLKDDVAFADRLGRWFAEKQIRVPVRWYDDAGRLRYREPAKVAVLARAMVRAVSRARDNELHVILADFASVAEDLVPLTKAVKLARARHHQVLVIVPGSKLEPTVSKSVPSDSLATAIAQSLEKRDRRNHDRLRLELTRAGAVVLRQNDGDPVRLVLDYLDRLRGARSLR